MKFSRKIIYPFIISISYSIVPPQFGQFSTDLLNRFNEQEIGKEYGNPGWVKKIKSYKKNRIRNTQLEFNIPVLLGKYSDVSDTYFTSTDFQNLLFDQNSSGSMQDYYTEISYGNFLLDGQTSGWYQSNFSQSEAVNQVKGYVSNVAALADPDFNYGLYDNDGPDNIPNSGDDDGYVDGIVVVYPGCLDGDNNIWAHQSSLGSNFQYITNDLTPDGQNIIIDTYMVCPELSAGGNQSCNTDLIFQMGTFAHEFGHVLGLPDLYDRDESNGNSEGVGEWCLMASANWLGSNGDTPGHMSAWCKIELGWIEPIIVSSFENDISLKQLATNPHAIKVWEDDYRASRYFLIENRQKVGFDSDLNGSGLLIYHVNENRGWGSNAWSFGPINDDENNKFIDVESADGYLDLDNEINRGDNGDPFPGTSNNFSFDNNSNPSSKRNDGYPTDIMVNNISDSDSIMFMDINPMLNTGYSIFYDENGIASTSISIGTESQWSGVVFTAERAGFLTEIDFGVTYPGFWNSSNLSWEVFVYDGFFESEPSNLVYSTSGTTVKGGWHTISVDSVEISANQEFFITVKFNDNGYVYSFDNTGEFSYRSYYSADGSTFYNELSNYGDANIRAKLSTEVFNNLNNNQISQPEFFEIYPNFPNPFNPMTSIPISINKDTKITLDIFDINGRLVEKILDNTLSAGKHKITWDGSDVSSGVYFAVFSSKDFKKSQKMILLK